MKFKDLLDMKLGDVLENYMSVESLECGYYYGIVHVDDLDKLFEEYDVGNHGDSFYVDTLINCELLLEDDDILEYNKLCEIMKNLDIDKH